ncbi:MAG: hypothetical protein JNL67_20615 [Planctomycetaceae bacterium]|nr:hypothetical protein [Planctomycetaceae bacterium]
MEQMSSTRWGLYPWFPEHGETMIHPEDVVTVKSLMPSGKVFQVVGEDGDYLVLSYGELSFRAKPELFRSVERPHKQIGDTVEVVSKGEQQSAKVVEIHWHHQKNEPFYVLTINGKKSSKRYWNADFR